MNNTLIISSEFPPGPGGIGQHTASLLKAWSSKESIHLLTNQDYCSPSQAECFNAAHLSRIQRVSIFIPRNRLLYPIRRTLQTFRLVRIFEFRRVIVSGRFPLWLGGLIKIIYPGRRVEAFVHGTEVTPKGNWQDKVNAWALMRMDKIYPVSSFTADFLPANIPANRMKIIPNGIDQEWLERAGQRDEGRLDIKGNLRLLTVGNLTYRKGQHRVIKALPAILQRFPDAHYHIVGLPTLKQEMLELSQELKVAHAVTFHGKVERENLYDFYGSCDIFIMLSENQADGDVEGFGIAILEANAFGMPAIGASGCGIKDAIDEHSGLLVDGDQPEEVASAVATLTERMESYRTGARRWAEAHSWTHIITKLEF